MATMMTMKRKHIVRFVLPGGGGMLPSLDRSSGVSVDSMV
jgi:hypothetical protein